MKDPPHGRAIPAKQALIRATLDFGEECLASDEIDDAKLDRLAAAIAFYRGNRG